MRFSAAVFVDTSNVYHNLKKQGTLEFFNYESTFNLISKLYDLKEIHFYDAIKDINLEPAEYAKQQQFHQWLKRLKFPVQVHTRKLQYRPNVIQSQVDDAAVRVGIVDACKHKLWALLTLLGLVQTTREKGIDVMLATDAIATAIQNKCGVITIFSGDADFCPVANFIKRRGGLVANLHVFRGSAKELRDVCHHDVLVDFDEKTGDVSLLFRNNSTKESRRITQPLDSS